MALDESKRLNQESIAAWDANATFWDERMGEGNTFHLELQRPAIGRLLGPAAGMRVLDLGCGNGLYARHLASLGVDVLAVDASSAMLDRAQAHGKPSEGSIEYRVVDATDEEALLRLGEATLDGAVANMLLMDVPDIAPMFRALARLLRARAPFVFSVMHPAFNGDSMVMTAESREVDGRPTIEHSVRVTRYLAAGTTHGVAIEGQPRVQPYFHRPLHALLAPAFAAGFVVDGLEEPAFAPPPEGEARPLSWRAYPLIPPILVVRMRVP